MLWSVAPPPPPIHQSPSQECFGTDHRAAATNASGHEYLMAPNQKGLEIIPNTVVTKSGTNRGGNGVILEEGRMGRGCATVDVIAVKHCSSKVSLFLMCLSVFQQSKTMIIKQRGQKLTQESAAWIKTPPHIRCLSFKLL